MNGDLDSSKVLKQGVCPNPPIPRRAEKLNIDTWKTRLENLEELHTEITLENCHPRKLHFEGYN